MLSFFKSVWKSAGGKFSLIVGGAVILSALITIPYAVITRAGDDGFLIAPNGLPLQWSNERFPLDCSYDNTVTREHLKLYNKARREYNSRVGKVLFGPCIPWMLKYNPPYTSGGLTLRIGNPDNAPTPMEGSEFVQVTTPWDKEPGGRAVPLSRKSTPHIIVAVPMWIAPEYALNYSVWLHELGHALGLKHDRLKGSIMYPKIQHRPGMVSNKDVEGLIEAYND